MTRFVGDWSTRLDCRPDLARDFDALCVWVQTDVWSTHVYALKADSDTTYGVEMFSVSQEERGQRADDERLGAAPCDGADDSASFRVLGDALRAIAGGSPIAFPENDPLGLRAAWEEAEKAARGRSMSKYQRKAYLRGEEA